MIRTGTFVSTVLCLALVFGLFKVKYEVQALDGDLRAINHRIAADQARIHELDVSWSYLTQPDKLRELAQRHLTLQPLTSAQLGSYDAMPLKNDAPVAVAAASAPAADPNDVPIEAVLKAMQVAARGPAETERMPVAAAKPRDGLE